MANEFAKLIKEFLGEPVVVDAVSLNEAEETGFEIVSFDLYKETAALVLIAANTYTSESDRPVLPRNQAVCCGLLIRIAKFMTAIIQMSATADRREVVMALNRCILESIINLKYVTLNNDDATIREFVSASLGTERELYDVIQRNIKERGGEVLPIEKRMLASVERVFRLSGLEVDVMDPRPREWGGGLKNRLRKLGEEDRYVFFQRIPSHAIHGTWVDLVLHHLDEADGGFAPVPEPHSADARLLLPMARVILEGLDTYWSKFYQTIDAESALPNYIGDLIHRMAMVDSAHEEWLQNRNGA